MITGFSRALAWIGTACVLAALIIIWAARFTITRDLYVSELGATGMPTAKWFQAAHVRPRVG